MWRDGQEQVHQHRQEVLKHEEQARQEWLKLDEDLEQGEQAREQEEFQVQ